MDILRGLVIDRRRAGGEETDSVQPGSPVYSTAIFAHAHGSLVRGRPVRFDRDPSGIHAIVLHSTSGHPHTVARLPRGNPGSYHRNDSIVDRIAAHFVVLADGHIVYTHDIQYLIASAGGRHGIDIEFAGTFPPRGADRLRNNTIHNARLLVTGLVRAIPTIRYIHPHGQIQTPDEDGLHGKLDTCPGPDVWVNVGEWAVRELGLSCEPPNPAYYRHNWRISRVQRDRAFYNESADRRWLGREPAAYERLPHGFTPETFSDIWSVP